MEVLRAMELEFQAIEEDIKLHPNHINDYDLFACMREIEEESNRCFFDSEKEKVKKALLINIDSFIEEEEGKLLATSEYKELSKVHQKYWNECICNLSHSQKVVFLHCEESSNNISLFFKRKLCSEILDSINR
ncbi:MAG: hypothetical protein N4A63_04850 [Vallitalea sp.]|jgi:hypothetical protein|nr:hypothetical protein [Vallitalea sp.]